MSYSQKLSEKRSALLAEAEQLVAAAEAEGRDLTTEEDAKVAAAIQEAKELDESIRSHSELEARSAAAAELRKENGLEAAVGGARVVSEARTYTPQSGNSFVQDAYAAQFLGDPSAQERINRHQREERIERRAVTTSNFAGLVVPQYLTDLAAPFRRAGRPLADVARKHTLPAEGMTVNISKVTTGTSVAAQTQGSAVDETNMDDTLLTLNVITLAGQQTVSRQALERGTGVDQIVMQDLGSAWNTTLDAALCTEVGSSAGQSVTYTDASPTVAEIYPKLADAIQKVQTNYYGGPNVIVMHPRRLAWFMSSLDTTNRPVVVPAPVAYNPVASGDGAPVYGNSGYAIMGIPVLTDANVTTAAGAGTNEDQIYIGSTEELHLWESNGGQPLMLRFDQTSAASLNILAVVFGYTAYTANRYPNAWAKISGTGLVTPTF